MPTRTTAPIGAPCWVDLMTSDADRSRGFYSELFGWTAEDPNPDFGGYFNFRMGEVRIAGCMSDPAAPNPDLWSVYLAVTDARKTVDDAAAHGGQVIVPVTEVADLGVMAVVADPSGAAIGIWEPRRHPGFGIFGETGTPSWFELHTRDYRAAVDFYRDVFGWSPKVISDTEEFRYTVLPDGEGMLAGIMDSSGFPDESHGSQWFVYFAVDDADAALARVTGLGGSVVQAAEDTPYGRLATATDATGALFRLVAPNEAMPARSGSGQEQAAAQ